MRSVSTRPIKIAFLGTAFGAHQVFGHIRPAGAQLDTIILWKPFMKQQSRRSGASANVTSIFRFAISKGAVAAATLALDIPDFCIGENGFVRVTAVETSEDSAFTFNH